MIVYQETLTIATEGRGTYEITRLAMKPRGYGPGSWGQDLRNRERPAPGGYVLRTLKGQPLRFEIDGARPPFRRLSGQV